MVLNCPPITSTPRSSSSNEVVTGRTTSASRQSFSIHGCSARMNSIFGLLSAFMKLLLSFQHVIQEGESVHIMCISGQPGMGYVYFLNWFSAGSRHSVVLYQLIGGLSMASWTRSLGIICFGTFSKSHP